MSWWLMCRMSHHLSRHWVLPEPRGTHGAHGYPGSAAQGDLSTSTASPSVWGHEGRSSPSCVAAPSWGQTQVLPMSWLAQALPV